jgi:hypothetical protein
MSLLDKKAQNMMKSFNFKLDFTEPTKLPNYNEVAKEKKIHELEDALKAINTTMIKFYLKISPEYDASTWEEEEKRLLHCPPLLIFEYIISSYQNEVERLTKKHEANSKSDSIATDFDKKICDLEKVLNSLGSCLTKA